MNISNFEIGLSVEVVDKESRYYEHIGSIISFKESKYRGEVTIVQFGCELDYLFAPEGNKSREVAFKKDQLKILSS